MAVRDPDELIGYCGLYCGACDHYLDGPAGASRSGATSCGREATAGSTCSGCRSEHLYSDPGCAECAIRECARARGLAHCGECEDMPCDRIVSFVNDGHEHHLGVVDSLRELSDQGPAAWSARQSANWRCACGTSLCWKDRRCPTCGAAVA